MWTSVIVAVVTCAAPPQLAPETAIESVRGWALNSQDNLARGIGEYALIFASPERATAMGTAVYAYDRARRTVTIAIDEIPVLMIRGRTWWLYLWADQAEIPSYVRVEQSRDVTMADIEALAARLQQRYAIARPEPLPTLLPVATCFEDGAGALIPRAAKACEDEKFIRSAHPDELLIGLSGRELDPERNPVGIQFHRRATNWMLAFDSLTGRLGMAVGEPDATDPLRLTMLLKGSMLDADDRDSEEAQRLQASLPKLPDEARIVSPDQLQTAYLDAMRSHGVKRFEDLRDALQENLVHDVRPALDKLTTSAGRDPDSDQQAELALARWRVRRAEQLVSLLDSLITDLQSR